MGTVVIAQGAVVYHPRGAFLLLERQDQNGDWLYDELRDHNGMPSADGDPACCFGRLPADELEILEAPEC